MKVANSLSEIPHDQNSVVSVGTFDGVHLAHRKIIKEVVQRGQERNGRSVIVTFNPHPKEVVGKTRSDDGLHGSQPVELLTTHDEKLKLLADLGVNVTFVVPFTYEFSRRPFRDFYAHDIVDGIGVGEVIEGYDHGFGRDREAGLAQLLELGREFGFSVVAEKQFMINGTAVSSSQIRAYLSEGDVAKASDMLGRRYAFSGVVVRGDRRGRELGFPTANLALNDRRKMLPGNGVYAVVAILDGTEYRGLMSIGVLPTFFDNHEKVCEVFLFDFDKDIYGKTMTVECVGWIRGEKKFQSAEELVKEMGEDTARGKRIFENVVSS
ncbi:MAG TPA: riboflavin biosynthesis protein RibF [Bacteroidota bacterium]|nr:riboflavin biosynthesis protein RibF [Bacteroidota bacterium]